MTNNKALWIPARAVAPVPVRKGAAHGKKPSKVRAHS